MKIKYDNKTFLQRAIFLIIVCLVIYLILVIHCLHSVYSFDDILQGESSAKIVDCSLDVCSSEEDHTIQIDINSELYSSLIQALQSEHYTKPLFGSTVSAYSIERYPFYRILLQHEDYHRTEVVVNGSFLLIGYTTGPGLTVYQAYNDDSLIKMLDSLF